jgi:hypothetical protein
MNFKTWMNCNCSSNHRTYRTWIKCKLPRAWEPSGEGPWMVIKVCERYWMPELYKTKEEAIEAGRYGSGTCKPYNFIYAYIGAEVGKTVAGDKAAQKAERMKWLQYHPEDRD